MTSGGKGEDERTVFEPKSERSGPPDVIPAPSAPPPPATPPPLEEKTTFEPAPPKKGPAAQFAVGDVLNDIYRITRFIARGGMGEVYEACNIHPPEERVAVKIMLQHLAQDELVAAMFAKEAAMLLRLHHEAIVQYRFATRDSRGRPFIVTEFVDGPSLEDRLGKLQLTDDQFAALAQKLAAGLGTAHTFGAIHRDIAPDNILLVNGDPLRPKIIDFGIAKDAREQTGTIVGDGFAGKLKYVAPEQLGEFDRNVGAWSDIYSLALTLRALAAGQHSDMGGSLADAIRKRHSVPDLAMISPRFRYAFERALQPDPADRPQSMAEFNLLLAEPVERTGVAKFGSLNDSSSALGKVDPAGASGSFMSRIKAGMASLGEILAAAVPDSLAHKKVALMAVGGIAALALLITVVVIATSPGESDPLENVATADDASASGTGPPSAMAPGSPAFTSLATAATANVACAWLTFDGVEGSMAKFSGGAGNPAAAQSAIVAQLEQGGAGNLSIDLSEVVRFDSSNCALVDALRQARSKETLISTPQHVFEAEVQSISTDVGSLQEKLYAKVLVRGSNLPPAGGTALLSIKTDGAASILTSSRAQTNEFVTTLNGNVSADGFVMPIPADIEPGQKDGYGIVLLSAPASLPNDLVGQGVKIDETWAKRFAAGASGNGWTVDIAWFLIEDRQPQ